MGGAAPFWSPLKGKDSRRPSNDYQIGTLRAERYSKVTHAHYDITSGLADGTVLFIVYILI